MRFSDFFDLKNGPEALVRFAIYPLIILGTASLTATILSRLSGTDFLIAVLFVVLMSPLAYQIREARQGRRQEPRTRRGAERTPLLPQNEEDE